MKIKLTILSILHFFSITLFSQNIYDSSKELSFEDFYLNNLEIVKGDSGKEFLSLKNSEYIEDYATDILLHFNNDFTDSANNYIVDKHYNNLNTTIKKYGKGSAYFINEKEIIYRSEKDTMFNPGRVLTDFSIEFWINPTSIGSDSSIFVWKGVNKVGSEFISQKINAYFNNRSLVWSFKNLFISQNISKYEIELTGNRKLIPDRWSHHLLRYDSETGMIEYLIDGIPEDVKYTTLSYMEDKEILTPYIGSFSKNEISIGSRYRGFIDEFRISESFILKPELTNYSSTGYFISPVIKLNSKIIELEGIINSDIINSETKIKYYYKVSSEPFLFKNNLSWKEVLNIESSTFKYIQFKADFYSSGNRDKTPLYEKTLLEWNKIKTPPPPDNIKINNIGNTIELKWLKNSHLDISGYKIYYGSKSNYYEEVIDIGDKSFYTIKNLEKNKIYYFSIRAYNSYGMEGEYSSEFYSRTE